MPTYTIRDKNEDEYYDTICSWSELQEFLRTIHIVKRLLLHHLLYLVSKVIIQNRWWFQRGMSKIADSHPNSPLADKVNKTDTIAQNKVRNVAKKHKLIDVGGQNLGQKFKKNKSTGLY